MYIFDVENVYDLEWAPGVKYGEIFKQPEYEHSKFSFELANGDLLFEQFDSFEGEALRLLDAQLVHPAYDYILKASHTFNLLDARSLISPSDRAAYLGRIRKLARGIAKAFVAEREALGFPLLKNQTQA